MRSLPQSDFAALVGEELGVSPWIEITQERIDAFADCTGDRQAIHVDPEKAKASPFGTTIAQGFLTLSLLAEMNRDTPRLAGATMTVNYGINRLRFLSPVPSGARIRGRFLLLKFEEIRPGEVQTTTKFTVEIEGRDKPALVAEWLARHYV